MYYIHEPMKGEFLNANFQAPTFHIKKTMKFQNAYLEGNREKQSSSVLVGHAVDTRAFCGKINFVSHRTLLQTKEFVDSRLVYINGTKTNCPAKSSGNL